MGNLTFDGSTQRLESISGDLDPTNVSMDQGGTLQVTGVSTFLQIIECHRYSGMMVTRLMDLS